MSKYAYELNLPDYYIKTKGADGMTVTVEGKEAYDFFIKAVTLEKVREARIDQIKTDMAWQFMNEADLFTYIKHQQHEVDDLIQPPKEGIQ